MFRNLPLLLAALVFVLAIGGVARILFAPRRPRRGGFIASLPTSRVDQAPRVSANPTREFSRDSIVTNFGMF